MVNTRNFQLTDGTELEAHRIVDGFGFEEKRFYLIDSEMDKRTLLAVLRDNKWSSPSPHLLDTFFQMAKNNRNRMILNVFNPMEFDYEITVQKKFKCFRRNINIVITRTINKIKNTEWM
jgi:hypothetical protein